MEFVFSIIVLILSVVVHEVSHGVIADRLGDPTARLSGRLTLNPLKHLDFFGSVLLPILLSLSGGPIIGWAKPVPYNPYNLRNPEKGGALIGIAGPLSNFVLAVVFALAIRIFASDAAGVSVSAPLHFIDFLGLIVYINILLGIFNIIPIPPLDGSKLLFLALSEFSKVKLYLQIYGFLIILFLIFFFPPFSRFLFFIVFSIFHLFTGLPAG